MDNEAKTYEPKEGDFLVREVTAVQGNLISRANGIPTTPGITLELKVIDHNEEEKTIKIHVHDDVIPINDFNNVIAVAALKTIELAEEEISRNN